MLMLLAVVCLAVGGATAFALHRVLHQQIDDQLTASAGRSGRAFDQGQPPPWSEGGPPPFQFPRGQQVGTLIARIVGGQIEQAGVQGDNGDTDAVETTVTDVLERLPVDERPHTYELAGLGDYRVVARQMPDGAVLITGLPLANVRSTLYAVAGITTGVTVVVLLVGGLVGAMLIRRNLRPLARLAATATRVSGLTLDRGEVALAERVPADHTDPGTEVGQVGAALNRMLDHVSDALRSRHASETQVRQFVADASHELRTPLAAIRGYAELSRRGGHAVSPELAHVLRRVESEAQRMTMLVEDMLLLARLDAGRPLVREPVDLALLAVDAVSDAHAAGPDHDWRLELPEEDLVTVVGDQARLHQVLANLLANARVHTPPGTTVTVGVTGDATEAVLQVVDAGPGIPATLLPHVFERFARGDTSRSRASGSTGLGLAIVHAVVTAYGGTVQVDSVPGRTAFTVRLPRSTDESLPPEPRGEPADVPAAPGASSPAAH